MKGIKVACIVLVLTVVLTIAGCTSAKAETYTEMFKTIGRFRNSYVFYDVETKVMYIESLHGGVTAVVNPDGTPKLYSIYKEK